MAIQMIDKSHIKLLFPFNYLKRDFQEMCKLLNKEGFEHLHVQDLSNHSSEVGLEQFFYPFIEEKLFSKKTSIHHFNHFMRNYHMEGHFSNNYHSLSFEIVHVSVLICPFNTGMILIDVQVEKPTNYELTLDFIHVIRQLKMPKSLQQKIVLEVGGQGYSNSEELIFGDLLSFLKEYLTHEMDEGYFGSLPYFEDERMYCLSYFQLAPSEKIDVTDLYKGIQLDGTDNKGQSYISSFNEEYMEAYIQSHSYSRWEPKIYITSTFQVTNVTTSLEHEEAEDVLQHFHSTLLYNFLVHYFYKIVLLKLTYEHSEIKWSNDKIIAESLIEKITLFSSKYYFNQVAIHSGGRAIALLFRQQLRIDELFAEVKQSVNDLYRVVEDNNIDRYNQLLFVLTVFTVISGIFGMNLVIESWDKPIQLSDVKSMSFFEVIAFLTAILGIWTSLILTAGALIRKIVQIYRKKKHQA